MVRWAAGQASSLALIGTVLGREIGPADVEPLTWALAEQGRRISAAEYLAAINRLRSLTNYPYLEQIRI